MSTANELMGLIDEYWTIAYKEGQEGRSHDDKEGNAARVLNAIQRTVAALSSAPSARPSVPPMSLAAVAMLAILEPVRNGCDSEVELILRRAWERARQAVAAAPQAPAPSVALPEQRIALIRALRAGEQADADGTFVKVSREACEVAASLLELGVPSVAQEPAEHKCWLIETTATPTPLYFAGSTKAWSKFDDRPTRRTVEQFVADANDAIRFPTKESADGFLALQLRIRRDGIAESSLAILRAGLSCYRVAEHIFDYTPRAALAPLSPAQGPIKKLNGRRLVEIRRAAIAAFYERNRRPLDETEDEEFRLDQAAYSAVEVALESLLAVAPSPAQGGADETLYHELLFAVGNKYPGETRHETALRYIRQAEQGNDAAMTAPQGKP